MPVLVKKTAPAAAKPLLRRYSRKAPFVDYWKALVSSGTGGDGAAMFTHLPNKEFAGPGGASGGRGGSVLCQCTRTHQDLAHLKDMGANIAAHRGHKGGPMKRGGKKGRDVVLDLPPGTVITDVDTDRVVFDLDQVGSELVLLDGGAGGKGNLSFTTALSHSPKEATRGMPGNTMLAQFELKSIADVGLIGYPNAGKSALLGAISSAKPHIAPFPFATLHPTIGTLRNIEGDSCDVADLPGLIEGAYENRGLGHRFLQHVERTVHLVFVVDMVESYVPPDRTEPQQPWEVVQVLMEELDYFLPGLSGRGVAILANKMDVPVDTNGVSTRAKFRELQQRAPDGMKCFPVSALLGHQFGPAAPSAGLAEPTEYITRLVYQHRRDHNRQRQADKAADKEMLHELFRGQNPQLFAAADRSLSQQYNVRYVNHAELDSDLRYKPDPAHGGRYARTEEMLERRQASARAAAKKGGSMYRALAQAEEDEVDQLLKQHLSGGGGGSLVDQQLESFEGESGLGEPADRYLDLDDRGRLTRLRDTTTSALDHLRLPTTKG